MKKVLALILSLVMALSMVGAAAADGEIVNIMLGGAPPKPWIRR